MEGDRFGLDQLIAGRRVRVEIGKWNGGNGSDWVITNGSQVIGDR